jgi:hypothetical protein
MLLLIFASPRSSSGDSMFHVPHSTSLPRLTHLPFSWNLLVSDWLNAVKSHNLSSQVIYPRASPVFPGRLQLQTTHQDRLELGL